MNKQMKPLFMAPLAGFTDAPFRRIVSGLGSSMNFTEMISLKGLYYGDRKTEELLTVYPEEAPCTVQIFGHEPEILERTIERLNRMDRFVGIDLNMGCPAPKIVNNGDGAYMMTKPLATAKFIEKLVSLSEKPVSVKFRSGFNEDSENFLEIGKICEEAGCSFVTLHPRTRSAFYRGEADWNKIRALKDSLNIPVVGNGDVNSPEDIDEIFSQTGCDAVALGRGALRNPFLFRRREPSREELYDLISRHYRLKFDFVGTDRGVKEMRKHISYYIKGMRNSAEVKDRIMRADDPKEIRRILEQFLKGS